MRDVMSSVAGAGGINEILEAIIVNLHNVIDYDRASLYLADENERYVLSDKEILKQQPAGIAFTDQNPFVVIMRNTQKPVIVADIQKDQRFNNWLEFETIRSWLGAPLQTGEEMIGFLSLGSLEADSFTADDSERLQVFADQVAKVLDRASLAEQNRRRKEELEVLSSVTLALGQADGGENTLYAVLKQIARFTGAQDGIFIAPDRLETALVVQASLNEAMLGVSFPARWNPIWDVYIRGETKVIYDNQENEEIRL